MIPSQILWFGVLPLIFHSALGSTPIFTCPQYVEEGNTLTCDCNAPADVISSAVLTWPGHSVTSRLTLTNVSRALNGTTYTCRMTSLGVSTSAVYTLQVAYGPENNSVITSGLNPFPTNGSSTLTLTCKAAEVNPQPRFLWSGVNCDNGNQGDTCHFKPQPISDDQKRVACIVTSQFVGASVKSASAIFIVDLLYPPSAPPAMTSLDSSATFLKTGDVINCTVRGGKPAVHSVTFKCTDPVVLKDQADFKETDDVSGVTSVVSRVRVGAAVGRGESRTLLCQCFAKWLPEESLYTPLTKRLYPTQYSASITNFTLNGVVSSLTVEENDVTSVAVTCATDGRPYPNVTLSKMGAEGVLIQQSGVTQSVVTFSDVKCEMTGLYICSVNNGLAGTDQQLVSLAVLCGPRAVNLSEQWSNQRSPPVLTRSGLTFRLVSNPAPDTSAYTIVNSTISGMGLDFAPSLQRARLFDTTCRPVKDLRYLADCKVTPRRVTSQQLGVYAVTVSNRLGSYDFRFKVEQEILPLPSALKSSLEADVTSAAAIAGGIVGTLFVVAIIVVIVCFIVRRKWMGRKAVIESQPESSRVDDDEFVEHINEAYVSADAIDVSVQNTSALPRQPSADDFSTSSLQQEDVVRDDVSRTSSLRPPPQDQATDTETPRKKRSPRVSFYVESEQDTANSSGVSSGRLYRKSPRSKSPGNKSPRKKSPRNKSPRNRSPRNKLSDASGLAAKSMVLSEPGQVPEISPRNKVGVCNLGPQKSPRYNPGRSSGFPPQTKSPRKNWVMSGTDLPPSSPRNNAFMDDDDEEANGGSMFEERPTTDMSGDYAEIDSDGSAMNGRAEPCWEPRVRRSEYADLEAPLSNRSPRRRKHAHDLRAEHTHTASPSLPRGSIRGPLGDIYRTIDRSQKSSNPKSRNGKEEKRWEESEIPNTTNQQNHAEFRAEGVNRKGGYYRDGNMTGDNSNGLEWSDDPEVELPERVDAHKPAPRVKPVLPYDHAADVDAELYNDALSSRVRSPTKITEL